MLASWLLTLFPFLVQSWRPWKTVLGVERLAQPDCSSGGLAWRPRGEGRGVTQLAERLCHDGPQPEALHCSLWLEALHSIAGSGATHGSARCCATRNRCTSSRRHGRFIATWQALGAACVTDAHLANRQLHDPVRRRDVGGSDRLAAEPHANADRQV